MVQLLSLTNRDMIITAIMLFAVCVFYLFSGINLLVNRNPKSISKRHRFKNPGRLAIILGIIELVTAFVVIVSLTFGLIFKNAYVVILIVDTCLIIVSLASEFIIQRKATVN